MAEIIEDTCGRHDTLGGARPRVICALRPRYENDAFMQRQRLLALNTEYADLNLTKADLSHNVNFFMNVPVTPEEG